MYFTREALEQASSYEVSSYRAQRYRPFERVADLGCSSGADTLTLVQAVQGLVIGLDLDELRLCMAQANLAALDLADRARLRASRPDLAFTIFQRSLQGSVLRPCPASKGPARIFCTPVLSAIGSVAHLARSAACPGSKDLTGGRP